MAKRIEPTAVVSQGKREQNKLANRAAILAAASKCFLKRRISTTVI